MTCAKPAITVPPDVGAASECWRLPFIIIVATVLRTYPLSLTGFGVDDAYTVLHCNGTLREAVFWDVGVHPPLHRLLVNLMWRLGHSEAMLRLPGALFGVGTVWLTYRIVERLVSRRAAFCAGLALAIAPFHLIHSMSPRMYSPLLFFATASVWLLIVALDGQCRLAWAGHVAVTTLAIYTNYQALSLLAVHWLMVASTAYARRSTLALARSHASALLLFAPWAVPFLRPHSEYSGGGGLDVAVASLPMALLDFLWARSVGLSEMGWEVGELGALLLVAFLFLFGLDRLRGNRLALATIAGSVVVLTTVMFLIATVRFWHSSHHFILVLPMFLTLCAIGVQALQERWGALAWVYAAPALALGAVSYFNWFHSSTYPKTDWRSACRYVAVRAETNDVAVFDGPNTFYPFDYYEPGLMPRYGMPMLRRPSEKYVAHECAVTANAARVWLVQSGSQSIADPAHRVEQWYRSHRELLGTRDYGSIHIQLFGANLSAGPKGAGKEGT